MPVMDDIRIAKKYVAKADRAKSDSHDFEINFVTFKNMMRTIKCPITGVILTASKGRDSNLGSDVTIDRLDNSKGYVNGNVMAMSASANALKATIENPNSAIDAKAMMRVAKLCLKHNTGK